MKEACSRCDLNCTGHGLRSIAVTTVVNEPGVNQSECLAFSRHASVSGQKSYIRRSSKSEMAKFDAFGVLKKTEDGKKGDAAAESKKAEKND